MMGWPLTDITPASEGRLMDCVLRTAATSTTLGDLAKSTDRASLSVTPAAGQALHHHRTWKRRPTRDDLGRTVTPRCHN